MKIYLIRHGDPDYSTDTLTQAGKAEAQSLAEYLSTVNIDLLFTSPLGRARATAAYSESVLKKQAEVLDWTEEVKLLAPDGSDFMTWYGNPQHYKDLTYQNNKTWIKVIQNIEVESDTLFENLGWKRIAHQYHFLPQKNIKKELQIVLFSHGGFGLTWLAHLLNIPYHLMWTSFFLHTSSITTILFDERPTSIATPKVIALSALPHLYKHGLSPSTTGIQANYV